jgi:hypothetical protein
MQPANAGPVVQPPMPRVSGKPDRGNRRLAPFSPSDHTRWMPGSAAAAGRRTHAIGLMDHLGGGNLGDDTTQTAVIQNIRKRWPDARIYGFTMSPSDTEARHGIRTYPLRRRTWDRPGEALRDPPHQPGAGAETDQQSAIRRLWHAASRLAGKPRALLNELGFLARSYAAVRQVDTFILSGSGQFLDSWAVHGNTRSHSASGCCWPNWPAPNAAS